MRTDKNTKLRQVSDRPELFYYRTKQYSRNRVMNKTVNEIKYFVL